jgi:hypothetical protein
LWRRISVPKQPWSRSTGSTEFAVVSSVPCTVHKRCSLRSLNNYLCINWIM